MVRVQELVQEGWEPSPQEVARLLREVGADLVRLHEGGAVHGGVSTAVVGVGADHGFRLGPPVPAGDDPWLREPPEVVDGDAPTPASDTYELAAVVRDLLDVVTWELPEELVVAVERGLRDDPSGRPTVTALVVCAAGALEEVAGASTPPDGPVDLPPGPDEPDEPEAASAAPSSPLPSSPAAERVEAPPFALGDEGAEDADPADRPGTSWPDMVVHGSASGDQDRMAALREAFAAAAQEPERSGLRSRLHPVGTRPLVLGAVAVLALGGLWAVGSQGADPAVAETPVAAPGPSGAPADPAEPSAVPDRPAGGTASPTPAPARTRTAPEAGAPVALPTAEEVDDLLTTRAVAWVAGDREALARVVVRDSPAWRRDTGHPAPEGHSVAARYRVSDVRPVRVDGGSGADRVVLTAKVAAQGGDPRTVRLELEPSGKDGGPISWRLADWRVLAA